MSKIAVVYWSGTGNTESMAASVADGAREQGAEVDLFQVSDFDASMLENYDALAFGCPAMGSEELESEEFQPLWDEVKTILASARLCCLAAMNGLMASGLRTGRRMRRTRA